MRLLQFNKTLWLNLKCSFILLGSGNCFSHGRLLHLHRFHRYLMLHIFRLLNFPLPTLPVHLLNILTIKSRLHHLIAILCQAALRFLRQSTLLLLKLLLLLPMNHQRYSSLFFSSVLVRALLMCYVCFFRHKEKDYSFIFSIFCKFFKTPYLTLRIWGKTGCT